MEENRVCIEFESRSQNEGFARVAVSAFVSQLDPTIEEIADVKTAVSEAVTNSIIHGYENYEKGIIKIESTICGREVSIIITDYGKGIDDVLDTENIYRLFHVILVMGILLNIYLHHRNILFQTLV